MFILGDTPSTHPSEMLAQLYKQHPYLGKYQVNLQMDAQDDNLGYAYGSFLVSNPTDASPVSADNGMTNGVNEPVQPAPETVVRVPVIIRDSKGYSFDTFIDPNGKSGPLNEGRLATTLFAASAFSVSGQPDGAGGMGQSLNPVDPTTMYGNASSVGGSPNSVTYKTASVSVLSGVRICEEDKAAFIEKVASDPRLNDATKLSDAFRMAVIRVAENDAKEKWASVTYEPHVLVLSRPVHGDGSYSVLSAEFDFTGDLPKVAFANSSKLSKAAAEALDGETREAILRDGFTILSPAAVSLPVDAVVEKRASATPTEVTGIYQVMEKTGSAGRALVLGNLVTFTGVPTDKVLVISAAGSSFQDRVAGEKIASFDPRTLQAPSVIRKSDEGVFLLKTAGVVTEPVELASMVVDGQGQILSFLCEHPFMGKMTLEKSASVKKLVQTGVNSFLIPSDAVFIPIGLPSTAYMTDDYAMRKVAGAGSEGMRVRLTYDGEVYKFAGALLSSGYFETPFVDHAAFTLAIMGDTDAGAKEKLASCRKSPVDFVAYAKPGIEQEKTVDVASMVETAKTATAIRQDLTKEAANLITGDTVDSVLSLNFVTPENVRGYVDFLPVFEDTVSKLAELLIGVRLGVAEVPEPAVLSAMNGVEKAIQGLKRLSLQPGISG